MDDARPVATTYPAARLIGPERRPALVDAHGRSSFVTRLRAALRPVVAMLAMGFVLFFWSETVFWGRPDRAPFPELVAGWLVYALFGGATLVAIATFRVRSLSALVLCGALYGWLVEGVFVSTMYDAFPVNISWTGLAWHALLSVCCGCYLLPAALAHSPRRTALVAAALGAFWGAWAVMWWQPAEGGFHTPLPQFALHAALNTALLACAYAVVFGTLSCVPWSRRAVGVGFMVVAALWFGLVIVPQIPWALLVTPPLVALTLWTLRWHGRTAPATLHTFDLRVPPWQHWLALAAMPVAATVVYGLFEMVPFPVATNIVVYWITMPLGFALYGASLWREWIAVRGVSRSHSPGR